MHYVQSIISETLHNLNSLLELDRVKNSLGGTRPCNIGSTASLPYSLGACSIIGEGIGIFSKTWVDHAAQERLHSASNIRSFSTLLSLTFFDQLFVTTIKFSAIVSNIMIIWVL